MIFASAIPILLLGRFLTMPARHGAQNARKKGRRECPKKKADEQFLPTLSW
jgi:hypothetical protein